MHELGLVGALAGPNAPPPGFKSGGERVATISHVQELEPGHLETIRVVSFEDVTPSATFSILGENGRDL